MDSHIRNSYRLEIIRIVAVYSLFGALWIYLSDTVLGWLIHDPALITRISVYKGLLFIFLTAALLYFLIFRYIQRISGYISERNRAQQDRLDLERQLLHSQKLESLGVLAGGIAHDFNNLLTAIIGNLELALMRLPQTSPARNNIDQSMQASQKAADLTRQMLAYSGKGIFQLKPVDLGEIVRDNMDLFRTVVPRNVTLTAAGDSTLPLIMADPGQMLQVVLNLVTNAAESFETQTGVVTVTTGVSECSEEILRKNGRAEKTGPVTFVFVEVADNGCGMNEETLKRLFEPFFTTKFPGRGLGMAATQGIVHAHHGILQLESREGTGTTIRALFPVARDTELAPYDLNAAGPEHQT